MTLIRCLVGHSVSILTDDCNVDAELLYVDEYNGGLLDVMIDDQRAIVKDWFAIVATDMISRSRPIDPEPIIQPRITQSPLDPEHQYMNIPPWKRKEIIARLNYERQMRNRRQRRNR